MANPFFDVATALAAYDESQYKAPWFRNYYRHCGQEWQDEHDCMCNDKCPVCNKEIEPYTSDDLTDGEPDPVPMTTYIHLLFTPDHFEGEKHENYTHGHGETLLQALGNLEKNLIERYGAEAAFTDASGIVDDMRGVLGMEVRDKVHIYDFSDPEQGYTIERLPDFTRPWRHWTPKEDMEEHSDFPLKYWIKQVWLGNTRRGYVEWVNWEIDVRLAVHREPEPGDA